MKSSFNMETGQAEYKGAVDVIAKVIVPPINHPYRAHLSADDQIDAVQRLGDSVIKVIPEEYASGTSRILSEIFDVIKSVIN